MAIIPGFGKKQNIIRQQSAVIEQQKALLAEVDIRVTEQNELFKAVYSMLSTGMPLSRDSKTSDYIREGYEGNPDIFAIVLKLAGMFSQVMDNARLVRMQGGKEVEVEDKEIEKLFEQTNYYQNFFEFCRLWHISYLITGEAITYAPRYPAGLNAGKITQDGLLVMPSQNVEIKSRGWRKPIGEYYLNLNETYKIQASDVWHERFAPTLTFEGGKNFRGMSPLKVAASIVNSQNKGYEVTAKMYAFGHPPGILSKESDNVDAGMIQEQESKFRERYKTKYQGVDNMAIPIFTLGKLNYTKIGYDNLKELEVVAMSEHGRRVLANLWQVPSWLLNDPNGAAYNNQLEASKAIYTNRIIPDVTQFCSGFNQILRAYGDFYLKPDFSGIEALQEDKVKKVEWVSKLYNDGVVTGDEYLELLGLEATGLPEMQVRYQNVSRVPLGYEETAIDNSDKFYKDHNIQNQM